MTSSFKLLAAQSYDGLKKCATVFASKRSLARILSTFLCCIAVVVTPFSTLGGNYAFLVLALKELVFSVQASLAQQLELTILNILGALMGIAVSTLGKFIAAQSHEDSPAARGICALFLVLICFFGENIPLLLQGVCTNVLVSGVPQEPPSASSVVYADIMLRFRLDSHE